MNRLLILPVLLLTLLVGNPAFSADFQKGLTAAESGKFDDAGNYLVTNYKGWCSAYVKCAG